MSKQVLIVGASREVRPFQNLLQKEGLGVSVIENLNLAFEEAKKMHPQAILFILPVYWEPITDFVKKIKAEEGFSEVPIIYLGSLIEGEDQIILQQHGVITLTLGPVPTEEIVRYIVNLIS